MSLVSLVIEHAFSVFQNYGKGSHTRKEIVMTILQSGAFGFMVLLGLFYSVLHAMQNAFAEMLRFADRTFYKVREITISP